MARMVCASRPAVRRLIGSWRTVQYYRPGETNVVSQPRRSKRGIMGANQPVRIRRHRGKAVVLLAAAALVAAACGNDDNSGSSATAAPGTNAAAATTAGA